MFSTRFFAALIAILLCVAGPATADPRWWWDDVPITANGFDKAWPDATIGGGDGGQGGAQFIVWQQLEPGAGGGDWEIWLTVTGDQGCTFCPPVRLTDNNADDIRPRVGVSMITMPPPPFFGLQVAYESEGNVMLAYDDTISVTATGNALCQAVQRAADNIRTRGQVRRLNLTSGTARRPDIDLSTEDFSFLHMHVVWEDSRDGAWDIWTDRDLIGDGSGYGGPMNLTAGAIPAGDAAWPSVSGDSLGASPGEGGVSVAFLDAGTGQVLYLRSSDSGASWSATGALPPTPPVGPPLAITASGPAPSLGPVIESSELAVGMGGDPLWEAVGWVRAGSGQAEADAQHLTGGSTGDVPWNFSDYICGTGGDPGGRAALALQAEWTPPPEAVWTFWSENLAGGSEIMGRAGVLNPGAVPPVDFGAFPYPPVRPKDRTASAEQQLSACIHNEATWNCNPARTGGDATQPVAFADTSGTYLVWVDSRSGSQNLYYKRTDEWISGPLPRITSLCETFTEARIEVEFAPVAGCASAFPWAEKVRRYLVYYGTDPQGPYANAASPIVVLPGGPSPLRATIGGLALGTDFYVVVIAEDEARNVDPPSFDPASDNPTVFKEGFVTTPGACMPMLALGCAVSGESCPDPLHPLEGQFDFGETMLVTLTFQNTGTLAATNFTADFGIAHAVVNLPPGGAIAIPSIPAGESVDVIVGVTIDPEQAGVFDCSDPIDMGLSNMQSDGGTFGWPDDPLSGCDYPVGGGDGTCTSCSVSPNVIVTGCQLLNEVCAAAPRPPDGVVDPMERVTLRVAFTNVGTQAASAFEADVALPWGGTAVSGFGTYAAGDIPVGGSTSLDLVLDAGDLCGDALDVDITNLRSNMGLFAFPDAVAVCDRLIGSNPVPSRQVHENFTHLNIPDNGTEVSNPLPVSPDEPRRADLVTLIVRGQMPPPANLVLRLEGPGGPPGLDVSGAWNAADPGLDITDFYNGPQGGPGDYTLFLQDTQPGGGQGDEWQIAMAVTDSFAECDPCGGCTPFSFGGATQAGPSGDCGIAVSWELAMGKGTLHYDLYQDGILLQSDLRTTTYLDSVSWGSSHTYQVEAYDDCAPPGRGRNALSPAASPADAVGPFFIGQVRANYSGTVTPDCTVRVTGAFGADCAPVTLVEILRDGALDWSGPPNPLPYDATVPQDGTYVYSVRVTDAAGNVTTANAPAVVVDNCAVPAVCLGSAEAPDLAIYVQNRPTGWFLVPPGPGNQHVDDPTPVCPFAPGDRLTGVVGNGVALTFYDLNSPATDLRLRSDASAGNPDLVFQFTP